MRRLRDMRYRRRRCMRRPPNPAKTASLAGRALSRSYFPVAPIIVFVVFLFIELVVVVFVVGFFVGLVLVVVLIIIVVVGSKIELDRRQTRNLEIRAALGTADLIAFVDVKFVDF